MATTEENVGRIYIPTSQEIAGYVPDYQPASVPDYSRWQNAGRIALHTGAILLVGVYGAARGAEQGVREGTHSPTAFVAAPGVQGESWPLRSNTSVVETGIGGNVYAPHLNHNIGDIGPIHVGTLSVLFKLDTVLITNQTITAGEAFISDPKKSFEQPFVDSMKRHIENDAATGAEIGGGIGLGLAAGTDMAAMSLFRRRRRRHEQQRQDDYDSHLLDYEVALHSNAASASEQAAFHIEKVQQAAAPPEYKRHWKRKLGAVTLGILAMGTTLQSGAHDMLPTTEHAQAAQTTLVDQSLLPHDDLLQGLAVTANSPLDVLINNGLTELQSAKNNVDVWYTDAAKNLNATWSAWAKKPANELWLNHPGLVPVVFIDGTHCSVPYSTVIEPELMRLLKPLVIVNLGNVDISTGTLPFEQYCPQLTTYALQAAINATGKNVSQIFEEGDHDSIKVTGAIETKLKVNGADGKPYAGNIVLGLGNTGLVKTWGLTFAGLATPIQIANSVPAVENNLTMSIITQQTDPGGTLSPYDLAMLSLAKNGEVVAKLSCSAFDKTGLRPIGVSNSREQLYLAMEEQGGCVSAAFSGEGPGGVFSFTPRKQPNSLGPATPEFMYIESSSAGNGITCGLSPYEKPGQAGPVMAALFDPTTNTVAQYITLTMNTDGTFHISDSQSAPNQEYNHDVINQYLATYGTDGPLPPHPQRVDSGPSC